MASNLDFWEDVVNILKTFFLYNEDLTNTKMKKSIFIIYLIVLQVAFIYNFMQYYKKIKQYDVLLDLLGNNTPNNYTQCSSDLTQCSTDLATSEANFAQCSTDLTQCESDLDLCLNPPLVEPEGPGQTCFDGLDNDNDGLTDCDDPDCSNRRQCKP